MKKLNEYIRNPLNLEELMNVKGGIVGGVTNSVGSAVVSGWGGSSLLVGSSISISIPPINITSQNHLGLADCTSYACETLACTSISCYNQTCKVSGCKTKQTVNI